MRFPARARPAAYPRGPDRTPAPWLPYPVMTPILFNVSKMSSTRYLRWLPTGYFTQPCIRRRTWSSLVPNSKAMQPVDSTAACDSCSYFVPASLIGSSRMNSALEITISLTPPNPNPVVRRRAVRSQAPRLEPENRIPHILDSPGLFPDISSARAEYFCNNLVSFVLPSLGSCVVRFHMTWFFRFLSSFTTSPTKLVFLDLQTSFVSNHVLSGHLPVKKNSCYLI